MSGGDGKRELERRRGTTVDPVPRPTASLPFVFFFLLLPVIIIH
jgi:hypothetical protein